MSLFDLFRRSRSRCAPNSSRKRARCSVELLESRLAPSGGTWPYPEGHDEAPPEGVGVGGYADGDYGVTWSSDAQDDTGWSVYAPYPAASGAPHSEAFLVATAGDQGDAAVLGLDGSFVIAWSDLTPDDMGGDISGHGFDAPDVAQGETCPVNDTPASDPPPPATADDGTFGLTWSSDYEGGQDWTAYTP